MRTRTRIRAVVAMVATLLMVFSGTALAAVSFHGPAVSNHGASASSLTLAAPALTSGDVLLAQVTASKDFSTTDVICPPSSGWESIEKVDFQNKIIHEIFSYTASGDVGATNHTWTVRSGSCGGSTVSGKGMTGGLMRYSGVTTIGPDASSKATGSSEIATAPSVATTEDGAMIVRFFSAFKDLTFSTTANRLYTTGSSTTAERTAAAYQASQTTAGATGTFSASMNSSAEWVSTTVALQGVEEIIPVTHTLDITKTGTGTGTVTSAPPGIDCGSDCSAAYDDGTTVTLTATDASGSTFAGWSGGGGTVNLDGTYTVSMSQARSVTATFNLVTVPPDTYLLSVSKDGDGGGTVTSDPTGIECGSDCTESYDDGTTVTLTASPDGNSDFAGWGGAGTTNVDNERVVEMTEARSVTATFDSAPVNSDPPCELTGTFLAPIKDGARNIVKLGNVIPVKMSVVDCDGNAVEDATLSIRVTNGADSEDTAAGTEQVVESVSSADTGGVMRLADDKYVYNLATKSLKGGFDYTIVVKNTTGGVSWNDAPEVGTAAIQPKK